MNELNSDRYSVGTDFLEQSNFAERVKCEFLSELSNRNNENKLILEFEVTRKNETVKRHN